MKATLTELHRLLSVHDHPGQAEILDHLIGLHDTNREEFVRVLQSNAMWGGAGAVWEVSPMGADERVFRSIIVILADEMDRTNVGFERSRSIAETFRVWNEQGL
jgi:hypothetical protein